MTSSEFKDLIFGLVVVCTIPVWVSVLILSVLWRLAVMGWRIGNTAADWVAK